MTNPREFDALIADATRHSEAGRLEAAVEKYRAALRLRPHHAGVLHNLGVLEASAGRHSVALAAFDTALAVEPQYASAHYNRGAALQASGRLAEAIEAYARTIAIDPEHYSAHRALGLAYLAAGQRGRAMDHLAHTYELRRGDGRIGIAADSLFFAHRAKLRHDAEQFRYIARSGRESRRFEAVARNYEALATDFPIAITVLSDADLETLGGNYNTPIHVAEAPEIPEGALGPRADAGELVRQFESPRAGAVYFDDMLSPRALHSLRRYLLTSTIWHDFRHIDGFVASYLEDGLACPVLLQIIDELRGALSALLGKLPLIQAWAFKALEPNAAIEAHADDAAVSINFWITPDPANLSPGRGGMAICRVPPPQEWRVREYHEDRQQTVPFLEQHRDEMLVIPYRANRAVLFESRLLHRTDAADFAKTYENHRINITFLFGESQVAGCGAAA
jgi:tetratricopeptide (TPR) repeat protein